MKLSEAGERFTDQEILTRTEFINSWKPETSYNVGERVKFADNVYKCRQAHDSLEVHTPDIIPALWEVIDVEHTGNENDPIPYVTGMEIFKDKLYIENDVIYKCIRNSETPLYHPLSALIGNYVELVE